MRNLKNIIHKRNASGGVLAVSGTTSTAAMLSCCSHHFFKKRCPSCTMELREEKEYPEGCGKKFCSENRHEEYRKKRLKEELTAGSRSHH